MQKLKNEKGITLIALVITVAVLSIISIPVLVNMTNIDQFEEYTKFKDDIDILRESISVAYHDKDIKDVGPKYESLEFLKGTQNGKTIKNANDNDVYYVINIDKVNENLSVEMPRLNNGNGNKTIGNYTSSYTGSDDVYIINEQSKTIYYAKGITYNGETYYRLNEEFSEAEIGVTPGVEVKEINRFYTDIYGAKAKIPVGYKISNNPNEQIVSKGLVISDTSGNEFVWIPVQEFKNENDTNVSVDFDRRIYGEQYSGGISESFSLKIKNKNDENNYFDETKDKFEALSVIENKGFYIGRYETGTTESSRTSNSNTSTSPSIKSGLTVYNFVKLSEAKSLAENYAKSNNYVKSRLCSSYVWDTVLRFIEQTLGNSKVTSSTTSTSVTKTGGSDVLNNIYNLNGNAFELTTESYSDTSKPNTKRGGTTSASARTSGTDVKDANTGFRIALFLSI